MNDRMKYPRTRHLPTSRSVTDDDRVATLEDVSRAFVGREVVITEKMDGENTTIYADGHSHARSVDSKFHPSRSIVKELAGRIAHELPPTFRICGENIFAVHSIEYDDLTSHFQVFSVWDGATCLSWDETVEWCSLLGLETVRVLYRGLWIGEAHAAQIWEKDKVNLSRESEGFVVRHSGQIKYENFGMSVMKRVRPSHVQTSDHWMHQEMRVNGLALTEQES